MAYWVNYQGNKIPIDMQVSWVSVPGNQLTVNFTDEIPATVCPNTWKHVSSDAVDFTFSHTRVEVGSDEVNFSFDCSSGDVECREYWYHQDPLALDFTHWKPWSDRNARELDFNFMCSGGEVEIPPSLFNGFIEVKHGETARAALLETFSFHFHDGNVFSAKFNDFAETMFPHFHDGAAVSPACYGGNLAGLYHTSSLSAGSYTINSTGFTCTGRSDPSTNWGSNFIAPAIDARQLNEIRLDWYQEHVGGWSSNDNTSATLRAGLFFRSSEPALSAYQGEYRSVFYPNTSGSANGICYYAWLPFGTEVDGYLRKTNNNTLIATQAMEKGDVNLFDSTKITMRLVRQPDNTATFEIWANDVLLQSINQGDQWPNDVVPAWHYHNAGTTGAQVRVQEMASCDILTISPSRSMLPFAYDGSNVTADLATTHAIPLFGYAGESAIASLAADQQLTDIDAYAGEYTSAVLDTRVAPEFAPAFYDGAEVACSLATSYLLDFDVYASEATALDLATFPTSDLILNLYDGQTTEIAVQFAQAIGTFNGYTGQFASLIDLDTLENWKLFDGACVEAELATETTIPVDCESGEHAIATLDTRPSEGIGFVRVYDGSEATVSLTALVQVLLYPNLISTRTEIFCDFDSTTQFDLLDTSCCPVKESHVRIELSHQEAPDENYSGDKVIAWAELSAAPRFQFSFTTGEHFKGVDPVILGNFSVVEGQFADTDHVHLDFTDFKLCYGNFIPDPEFAFIELISTYDENCVADFAFTGETMSATLSNTVSPGNDQYHGETAVIDFEIPWVFRCYVGEHARISNPEFTILAFTGEYILNFNMYDEPFQCADGAYAQLGLTTDYSVEFLEEGCLDNEFVPSNEFGDPDWDKFNATPIEMDEYSHSILARCY